MLLRNWYYWYLNWTFLRILSTYENIYVNTVAKHKFNVAIRKKYWEVIIIIIIINRIEQAEYPHICFVGN